MNIYLLCAFLAPLVLEELAAVRTEACLLLFLLTYFRWGRAVKRFDENRKILQAELIAFAAIIVLYVCLGISTTKLAGMDLLRILWAAVSAVSLFVFHKLGADQRRKLFFILSVLCFASVLLELKNGVEYHRNGGYSYGAAYMSTFVFIYVCINYLLYLNVNDKRIKKLFLLSALVSFGVLFFGFQRGISIIVCLVCLTAQYILFSKPKKVFFAFCLLGLCLIAVYVFPEKAVSLVNEYCGERLAKRFTNMIVAFAAGGADANGSFQVRLYLIGRSLGTWTGSFENFVFGIGDHMENNFSYLGAKYNELISNHSDILDVLPKYGVFAGVLLFDILRRQYIGLMSQIQNGRIRMQAAVIYFGMVIRGLMGAVFVPQIAVAIALLLPLAAEYCEMKTETGDDIHN